MFSFRWCSQYELYLKFTRNQYYILPIYRVLSGPPNSTEQYLSCYVWCSECLYIEHFHLIDHVWYRTIHTWLRGLEELNKRNVLLITEPQDDFFGFIPPSLAARCQFPYIGIGLFDSSWEFNKTHWTTGGFHFHWICIYIRLYLHSYGWTIHNKILKKMWSVYFCSRMLFIR